ncbi:MAG: fibronectin type III domain-containing protein, partial [Clostridiaceae bacterium]|nr:fibronectin type III domain-containing protein [Clostridiaceae bacterium]
ISSDWSDSLAVRTLPYIPPETPKGFGVKNTADAITMDSIAYEWIAEDNPNIEYILELSENPDYEDSIEINAGKVSEYRVSGLRSNFRYYARLYAYDTKKELRSEPTQSVIARTMRSRADYDSDEYVEDVIKGDYIVKEYIKKDDLLNVYIQGVNADRFIEDMKNDNIVDYVIDLLDAPKSTKHIRLVISNRIFVAMEQLKENIIAVYPENKLTLTYGLFRNVDTASGLNELNDFDYEIIISLSNSSKAHIEYDKYVKLKSGSTRIKAGAVKGQLYIPYYSFGRPAKLIYESSEAYTIVQEYQDDLTAVIYDQSLGRWEKIRLKTSYEPNSDLWQFIVDIYTPGEYALAFYSRDVFDDISSSRYQEQINNVASVHVLKSISGGMFYPGKELSIDEAVKFALDVMDYDYGFDGQYLRAAYRSGIINMDDMENPYQGCTREKALAMAARIYELKARDKALPEPTEVYPFKDMDRVSPSMLEKVQFAIQNGFMSDRYSDMLNPDEIILRGEFIGILEKVLMLVGEI